MHEAVAGCHPLNQLTAAVLEALAWLEPVTKAPLLAVPV